jgi:GAF domain-containing protein
VLEDAEFSPTLKAAIQVRSILGVPLLRDDRVEGMMILGRTEPGPFTPRQIELVRTFADQAVIAIENARLFEEVQARTRDLQEALQRQTATAEVLKVISRATFDLQSVLDTLTETAVRLCDSDFGGLAIRDGEVFRYVAFHGAASDEFKALLVKRPIVANRDTIAGRVALEGDVVQIEDLSTDLEYALPESTTLGRIRTSLGVPLLRSGTVIGTLTVNRRRVAPFTERQIEVLRTFADQAVIAIENARLLESEQRRSGELAEALQQQTATSDVLKVISRSAFDLDAVLNSLTKSAVELCNSTYGAISLYRDGVLKFMAQTGCTPEFAELLWSHPDQLDRASVTGRTGLLRSVVLVPDVAKDEEYSFHGGEIIGNYRSLMGVPLLRNGELEGVFTLMRLEPVAFTQRQVEFVQTFADQAVIAIENARLFDEVQARTRDLSEALKQQTATAEVLKVISRSAFDLNLATSTILEAAAKLCRAPLATLHLRDGEVCRLVTQFGLPEAFERQARENPLPVRYPLHSRRRAQAGDVAHFSDAWDDPDYLYKTSAKLGGYRAIVVIPLMRQDELVGIFSLGRPEPEPFTPSQIKLVQTFADQAAIAIENARLFNEVRARTEDLSEALQQQTTTADVLKVISRSAFDLQVVFETLVSSAVELCGADAGTICVRDGGVFRYRASAGPGQTEALTKYLEEHPATPGPGSMAGRVLLSGKVEAIPDCLEDPDYVIPMDSLSRSVRSILGVPLLRNDDVEGALVLSRKEPGHFTPRQMEIIETFADQAVIAIENVRLFDEVQARTNELAASLDDLRKAQDRLIQSEKLASLGQLTAGIAHEIKNPLNFVNNYSTLSRELIDELSQALAGASLETARRKQTDALIRMVGANLDKVVSHGKRADSIVKNMLLHSREGSGERTSADINAMVEEALNLAYHGARAEKPDFNVTIAKSLDPNAGAADLYAQEMTRVLLNLISNGFYATVKRKQGESDTAYEPTITASTRDVGDQVEIGIRDNGTGIPDAVRAKMFNPFFTTKPAGEGTGLGLSLSHDIVVKQHGGTLEVLTEPGSYTQFTIVLPRAARGAPAKAGASA